MAPQTAALIDKLQMYIDAFEDPEKDLKVGPRMMIMAMEEAINEMIDLSKLTDEMAYWTPEVRRGARQDAQKVCEMAGRFEQISLFLADAQYHLSLGEIKDAEVHIRRAREVCKL